jgi:hypothetical protein
MKKDRKTEVESLTFETVASTIAVQCKCGEEFYASGKTADAAYKYWDRTHVCRFTLKEAKK